MAFTCDVAVWFKDNSPSRQVYIGPDRKAKTEDHAVQLAMYDLQAKGYNVKPDNIDEVLVIQGRHE